MDRPRNEIIQKIAKNPTYRIKQIYEAIYKQGLKEYSQISVLPKEMREKLESVLGPTVLTLKPLLEKGGIQTRKVLFETGAKNRIESVLMTYNPNALRKENHVGLCLSSQCGCGMGCKFCATGKLGFRGNLKGDEIVDQYLYFKQKGQEIQSVFFSGMGEPFLNPNIWEALNIFTNRNMINMGQRRISISTVGITESIKKLADSFPQINLAISLHTPFNNQRENLIPITKKYPINKILEACKYYIQKSNRKVFIAYILLKNTNDTKEHAEELIKLVKSQGEKSYLYHVNLINFHEIEKDGKFRRSSAQSTESFKSFLVKNGTPCTIRKDFGENIEAACGQLSAKY